VLHGVVGMDNGERLQSRIFQRSVIGWEVVVIIKNLMEVMMLKM
jgi:hypothetical protein